MPKDNEVDEKVIARYVWTSAGMTGGEPQWAGNWVRYDDHAATVAELRAEVASSKLQGELAALEQFLRMASEPVGQECCGQGRYECCGNPIPVFAQPNEVFQAVSDRHAEILAYLATLTGADPT